MTWRDWIHCDLENQFNPRVFLGAETERQLNAWAVASAEADILLRRMGGQFDVEYGPHPLMRYDQHIPEDRDETAPIIVNFHGGYWRSLDKADMRGHVHGLTSAGFEVFNVNYPLCPEVKVTEIIACAVMAVRQILKTLAAAVPPQPSSSIILMGHSAGAHLALAVSKDKAIMPHLRGVVAISPIIETEVVQHISANRDIRFDEIEAKALNLLTFPPPAHARYYFVIGSREPSGWIDQSVVLFTQLTRSGSDCKLYIVEDGAHFDICDTLCDSQSVDSSRLIDWLKLSS